MRRNVYIVALTCVCTAALSANAWMGFSSTEGSTTTSVWARAMTPASRTITVSTPQDLANLPAIHYGTAIVDSELHYFSEEGFGTEIEAIRAGSPDEVFTITDGLTTGVGVGEISWKPTKSGTYTFRRYGKSVSQRLLFDDSATSYTVIVESGALPTGITLASAAQRYPWENKIDVAYQATSLSAGSYSLKLKLIKDSVETVLDTGVAITATAEQKDASGTYTIDLATQTPDLMDLRKTQISIVSVLESAATNLVSEAVYLNIDTRSQPRYVTGLEDLLPFTYSASNWGAGSAGTASITCQFNTRAPTEWLPATSGSGTQEWEPLTNGYYVFTHNPGGQTAIFQFNGDYRFAGLDGMWLDNLRQPYPWTNSVAVSYDASYAEAGTYSLGFLLINGAVSKRIATGETITVADGESSFSGTYTIDLAAQAPEFLELPPNTRITVVTECVGDSKTYWSHDNVCVDTRTGVRTINSTSDLMDEIIGYCEGWGGSPVKITSYNETTGETVILADEADYDYAIDSISSSANFKSYPPLPGTGNGRWTLTHTAGGTTHTATFDVNLPFEGRGGYKYPFVVWDAEGLEAATTWSDNDPTYVTLPNDIFIDGMILEQYYWATTIIDLCGHHLSGNLTANGGTLMLVDSVGSGACTADISGSGILTIAKSGSEMSLSLRGARQRFPWNGWVDYECEVEGTGSSANGGMIVADITVNGVTKCVTNEVFESLSSQLPEGEIHCGKINLAEHFPLSSVDANAKLKLTLIECVR